MIAKRENMKFIKVSVMAFTMCISLYATDVEPFGGFNFGDTFTPVHEKLCKTKGLQTIGFGNLKNVPMKEFCESKDKAIKLLAQSTKSQWGHFPSALEKVNIKGFENVARYNLIFRADGINIKNVDFTLELYMRTYRDEQTAGSYLVTKKDTIKIDNFYVPLELDMVQLRPKEDSEFRLHQKEIFSVLWKKYERLVNKNNRERQVNGNYIDATGNDKTSIRFGGSAGIVYGAESYLDKFRKIEFEKYLKQSANSSKNDASSGL